MFLFKRGSEILFFLIARTCSFLPQREVVTLGVAVQPAKQVVHAKEGEQYGEECHQAEYMENEWALHRGERLRVKA